MTQENYVRSGMTYKKTTTVKQIFQRLFPSQEILMKGNSQPIIFTNIMMDFFFKLVAENASIHFQQTCNKLLGASDTEGWHC